MSESSQINRRAFLGKSAAVIAGGVVLPRTALSYENIVGANDRISLGHIGNGSRGGDLDEIASKLKSKDACFGFARDQFVHQLRFNHEPRLRGKFLASRAAPHLSTSLP